MRRHSCLLYGNLKSQINTYDSIHSRAVFKGMRYLQRIDLGSIQMGAAHAVERKSVIPETRASQDSDRQYDLTIWQRD